MSADGRPPQALVVRRVGTSDEEQDQDAASGVVRDLSATSAHATTVTVRYTGRTMTRPRR
jgi:hypothetical protein